MYTPPNHCTLYIEIKAEHLPLPSFHSLTTLFLTGARESRHHIKGSIGTVKGKPKKPDMWEHTLFQIQPWSSFLYILTPMNKNDRNLGKCHLGTDSSPVITNSEHCRTAHVQTKQNQDFSSLCRYKNLNFSRKWAGNLPSYHHLSLLSFPAYKTEPVKNRNLSSKPDLQTIYQVPWCLLKKEHQTPL